MRARLLATSVALLTVLIGSSSLLQPASAEARPDRPRPNVELTIAANATEYMVGDRPALTYSWVHKSNRDRLKVQSLVGTTWRTVKSLTTSGRRGSGTVTLNPAKIGPQQVRIVAERKKRSGRTAIKGEAATSFVVYDEVPITDIIRTYPASNADIRRGTTTIGGQAFPYTFAKYLTGENIWRTVLAVDATSCKGFGIPLGSRRHGASTGGTFGMQALGAGGAVVAQNAAAPDVGAGLLFATTVGGPVTVQVRADVYVDYFGSGQAICYTDDGRA